MQMTDMSVPPQDVPLNKPTESAQPMADPLLVCLAMMARALGHPVHVQVLRSGFALDARGRVPLAAYPDMAHQHGLMAALSRTPLTRIPAYVLPVLMPLKDGRACILKQISNGMAHVYWADTALQEHEIPLSELQALARDEVLVVKLPNTRHE